MHVAGAIAGFLEPKEINIQQTQTIPAMLRLNPVLGLLLSTIHTLFRGRMFRVSGPSCVVESALPVLEVRDSTRGRGRLVLRMRGAEPAHRDDPSICGQGGEQQRRADETP